MKMIKQMIARALAKFGLKVVRTTEAGAPRIGKDALLHNFYGILKQWNFNPKHIVDVGANHGTWTREALGFFPGAYYTLLEPQNWLRPSLEDLLENPKIAFHGVGAGEKEGTFKFTILSRDDSSSFKFSEAEAAAKGLKQVDIPVVTLNNLLAKGDRPVPDIIKIDAEGLDLEVLRGANNFFGKTEIFMVEAAIVNKSFKNSFLDLINFMDGAGYRLFDITDLNRPYKPKVLWLAELVFVRKNGFLDSQIISSQ